MIGPENDRQTAIAQWIARLRGRRPAFEFTHAASELNVTQTAISHQIRRLEQELGIRLFVRQNRALALTPEAGNICRASAPRSTTCGSPPTGCCARTTAMC